MLSRALVFPIIDPEFKLNGTTLVLYYDSLDLSFEKYTYLYNKRLYNWLTEDLWYEPYNPGQEKFNK